jgi:hypothetical protein
MDKYKNFAELVHNEKLNIGTSTARRRLGKRIGTDGPFNSWHVACQRDICGQLWNGFMNC